MSRARSMAKRAAALAWAKTAPIRVRGALPELPRRAERHYRIIAQQQGAPYTSLNDGALIAYARHNLTNYDALLGELTLRQGGGDAYHTLRARVDDVVRVHLAARGLLTELPPLDPPEWTLFCASD